MIPEPPAPFLALRPSMADAGEIAELITALDRVRGVLEETTEADVRRDWAETDFATDAVAVRDGDRLVAFGVAERTPTGGFFDGYVHPDSVGHGLGRYLIRTLEPHARELGEGPTVRTTVSLTDDDAHRLLEAEGYRPVRRWLRMLVDLDAEPIVPEIPGVEIRPLRPGEERAFHDVFERSFAAHWDHVPEPFEEWWPKLVERSGGDLSLLFVAESAGAIVGETSGLRERYRMGWVGTVGVVPEARGLGIGRALLLHQFASQWERGQRRVGLGVDAGNETGATRLYESVGMTSPWGAVAYEKELAGGTVSS